MNKSARRVSRSARRISSSGIDWPNEIVAVFHPSATRAVRHNPVLFEINPQRLDLVTGPAVQAVGVRRVAM